MSIAFRNVLGSAEDPVSQWPYEALVATLERGTLGDWKPVLAEVRARPWGVVARQIESYLGYAETRGVSQLMRLYVEDSRRARAASERAEVARTVREYIERSGLTREQFARVIGTSRSRLSTYASGTVVPSAALMLRMESVSAE